MPIATPDQYAEMLDKAKKGGFKDTSLEYMIYALLDQVRQRSGLDPAVVEDICLGNVRLSLVLSWGLLANKGG